MLGRLAKWLRLLGYDTAYESQISDWDIIRWSAHENRVLLTRDREILKRWQVAKGIVAVHLVTTPEVQDQLAEVRSAFGLEPLAEARCPEDNSGLESLSRQEAKDRVPDYVLKTQKEFRCCPRCGRVYWKATHWERIEQVRHGQAASPS